MKQINNLIKICFFKKNKLIIICHLINLFTQIIKIKEIINNQYLFNSIKTHNLINLIILISNFNHKNNLLFKEHNLYFLDHRLINARKEIINCINK